MPDSTGAGAAGGRLPGVLLVAFVAAWIALGIAPHYRQDWLLENLLVLVAVPFLLWLHRTQPLSDSSYACLFAFGLLHEVGAHYTYSAVPYEQWLQVLSGVSLQDAFGLGRNHYDRLMHLLYGLLVTPAAMELLQARTSPRGGWRWLLPVAFMGLHSVVYELVEWGAALAFGGELGAAYLGTQGDIWDAQQDMALALLGSVVAVTAVLWRDARRSASSPDPLAAASAPAGGNT